MLMLFTAGRIRPQFLLNEIDGISCSLYLSLGLTRLQNAQR